MKKKKNDMTKKVDLVKISILQRITNFQLQTQDDDFFHILEDMREVIVDFEPNQQKENK